MIAENKAEFFEQLQRELEKLGVEDTAELMADLEWHFAEGELRGVPESETCRELGSIAEIARSCLDLKSEAINSMVARDVKRKKGVSLTKPGHSVPADPSLAQNSSEEQTLTVEDAAHADLPSYTPEHISSEVFPNTAQNSPAGANIGTARSADGSNGAAASANTAQNGTTGAASSAAGTSTGGNGASSASAAASSNGGTFEKVGKAVDGAFDKAGKAINDAFGKAGNAVNDALNKAGSSFGILRPSDSYRKNINNGRSGGKIPQQFNKATSKGSKFVDTSGLKPNVNATRLTFEIVLDVILWIWVIPLAFALVITTFGGAIALLSLSFKCIGAEAAFGQFKFFTRLMFMLGFIYVAAAMFCLSVMLFKLPIALVKSVIKRHIKAVYDI